MVSGRAIGRPVVATCMAGYEGHRGWINYLAVAPQHRRQGIASQMMQAAESRLRAAGCPKINLQVRENNSEVDPVLPAHRLHAGPGWSAWASGWNRISLTRPRIPMTRAAEKPVSKRAGRIPVWAILGWLLVACAAPAAPTATSSRTPTPTPEICIALTGERDYVVEVVQPPPGS